jgi:hypothetical protein
MYIAILGIVANVLGTVFVAHSRMSALNSLALDRLNGAAAVERAFLEDVRGAEAIVEQRGPAELVLGLPADAAGAPRYRVLDIVPDSGLYRRADYVEHDGVWTLESATSQPLGLAEVSMMGSEGVVALRFLVRKDPDERTTEPAWHVVSATPRGTARPTEDGT